MDAATASAAPRPARPEAEGFWHLAEREPERVAVVDPDGTSVTYGALLALARGLAHGWRALGLRRGDGVVALLPNDHTFLAGHLAAMESGVYLTPASWHLAPAEVAYVLADSEAEVLLGHERLADLSARAADEAGFPAEGRFAFGAVPGFRPVTDLLAHGAGPLEDPSAGTVMMYTSGTTGRPKGVRRPLREGDPNAVAAEVATVTCRGFGVPVGEGTTLVCGPLYHAGPSVSALNAIHAGHTLVVMDQWAAEGCLELIERHHITDTQMVPTMFHRLLALPDEVRSRYDLSSVVSVLHTGAPCPVEEKQRMMDWLGPVVYETYGGTERAATIATPRRWLAKPGTVGKPIHGVGIRILDDEGRDCPVGTPGVIYIGSDEAEPVEYFKDPEKSASIRRGNAVTLGDVGYLDEDGFLFLCDRKIDMILSGGMNIYPAEVEAALLASDQVADATVIGVPDPEWGESVKAIVELVPGVEATPELAQALIAFCQERIARFKCPRSIDFNAALPRLPNGKIEKRRLRDAYWSGRGQAI